MENEIKELIGKYNREYNEVPPFSAIPTWIIIRDLESLLELYQSKCEVSPKKEMPTIHDTIYEIGGK